MNDVICYENSFLKQVIFRLDFLKPINEIAKDIPSKTLKKIVKLFPISESNIIKQQSVTIDESSISTNENQIIEHVFFDINRETKLVLALDYMYIEVFKYKSYIKLEELISSILKIIEEIQKECLINRIGLRYINVINKDEKKPLSWEGYITKTLLGSINFEINLKSSISRVFQVIDYNFDGLMVKFQFGIANSDFPAAIRKEEFILDLDSSYYGAYNTNEIISLTKECHDKIQTLFEASITPKTRKVMGQIND